VGTLCLSVSLLLHLESPVFIASLTSQSVHLLITDAESYFFVQL